MDDRELLERMWTSLEWGLVRLIAEGSPTGALVEREGVVASVCPAVPHRSLFSSVVYTDPAALGASLDELAGIYDQAGVRAWTVWVHPGDSEAVQVLAAAGHELDTRPMAMGIELDDLVDFPADGLAIAEEAVATSIAINERAFGVPAGEMAPALQWIEDPRAHVYVGRLDGRPLTCATTYEVDGEAGLMMVATDPAGQRRGLAARVCSHALREARERGCTTSTLQATRMGRPVYLRLGYRELGPLEMWERRS